MSLKKFFQNALVIIGYAFSVAGGVLGIVTGLILLRFSQPSIHKHAKMVIGASLATTLIYIFFGLYKAGLFPGELIVYLLLAFFLISAIIGGFLANKKSDFFTRGFFIALFTGAWGLSALSVANESRARENKPSDKHYWPKESWISLILVSLNIVTVIIANKVV